MFKFFPCGRRMIGSPLPHAPPLTRNLHFHPVIRLAVPYRTDQAPANYRMTLANQRTSTPFFLAGPLAVLAVAYDPRQQVALRCVNHALPALDRRSRL
jgi:hypothetical protein